MRIGFGYDVHPLVRGRDLILGGIKIPFEKGLEGHSDADALIHAIIDSLLGAANLGDIGSHFSDTNETYKGISSLTLLEQTSEMLQEKGFIISNIDSTIIIERPQLQSYIPSMQRSIADKLDIDISKISIKATRDEGLGFVGKGEGVKVFAVSMVEEK